MGKIQNPECLDIMYIKDNATSEKQKLHHTKLNR